MIIIEGAGSAPFKNIKRTLTKCKHTHEILARYVWICATIPLAIGIFGFRPPCKCLLLEREKPQAPSNMGSLSCPAEKTRAKDCVAF